MLAQDRLCAVLLPVPVDEHLDQRMPVPELPPRLLQFVEVIP